MPTAPDDLRDKMIKWFGNIDLFGPVAFLRSRGYTLTEDWYWQLPVPAHTISKEEFECMIFLQQEWDYGGLEFVPPSIAAEFERHKDSGGQLS